MSGGIWINHSGTALQLDVQSGMLNVTETESEDAHANFTSPGAGNTAWAGVDVNFSGLPSGIGNYFLHFSDGGTSNFRGKVFATTSGAAAGFYRIGITNSANAPSEVIVNADLALGTTYRVLFSTAVDTNLSSVEVVGQGTASDVAAATPTALTAINFRQSLSSGAGMGTLKADNVIVGTTRDDVLNPVPEPTTVFALGLGAAALAIRLRRKK